ncbi:MAG: glycosyltransferase family A protein [Leptolyngbyaceae cyanobacterium bins.302]|nr:glycosyltransferase family A protein [Leptolyngbyaceae cyanobacterium bins.302]
MHQSQSFQAQSHRAEYPLLSFAVPIYNGEHLIGHLLDSLLAQDFDNFEIVISDNASTDRTGEICQEYARRDRRIRYFRNPENIGLMPNFNRLIDLAQGKYMRWIGGDDWLEPDYARKCIAAIEARPDVIGVTTYQDFLNEDGSQDYVEYRGARLDSPSVYKRFARMIWFTYHDPRYIDPIYTMVRRDMLQKTGGHRLDIFAADQVLAVEMSILGAFTHVPECLAHRGKASAPLTYDDLLRQNFNENYAKVQQQKFWDLILAFWSTLDKFQQNPIVKVRCFFPLAKLFLIVYPRQQKTRLKRQLVLMKRAWFEPAIRSTSQ